MGVSLLPPRDQATPQYHHAREQAAAESQQTQTQPEVSPTLPDSDGESLRKMKSASMEPTPEEDPQCCCFLPITIQTELKHS